MWPSGRRLPATRGPTAGAHGALRSAPATRGLHILRTAERGGGKTWGGGGGFIYKRRTGVCAGARGGVYM